MSSSKNYTTVNCITLGRNGPGILLLVVLLPSVMVFLLLAILVSLHLSVHAFKKELW
jgi:hypothetical protein